MYKRQVPTSAEDGYRLPEEEEIEKYITDKTRAILLTNPGNPTGVVYELERVASKCLGRGDPASSEGG